eukprot:gene21511-28494_t
MSSSKGYVPNDFQYNGRVALALVPCLAITASLGGHSVMVTLAVGFMISYMMDVMQYREGALTCSWLTLAIMNVTFSYSMGTGYMMDVMQYREGALTCSWLTLAIMNVTFSYSMATESDSSAFLLIPLIFIVASLSGLVGMWISLQFR